MLGLSPLVHAGKTPQELTAPISCPWAATSQEAPSIPAWPKPALLCLSTPGLTHCNAHKNQGRSPRGRKTLVQGLRGRGSWGQLLHGLLQDPRLSWEGLDCEGPPRLALQRPANAPGQEETEEPKRFNRKR